MTKVRKVADIPIETISRFEEIYPMRGAFTWFVNSCLEQFILAHELTPDDLVKEAVEVALNPKSDS